MDGKVTIVAGAGSGQGAAVALTRAATIELARFNLQVSCVNPGIIRTAMVETAFPAEALDEAAGRSRCSPLGG